MKPEIEKKARRFDSRFNVRFLKYIVAQRLEAFIPGGLRLVGMLLLRQSYTPMALKQYDA